MDIVERLRMYGPHSEDSPFRCCDEAADVIERLRMECGNLATVETVREVNSENIELKAEIEQLRELVRSFVLGEIDYMTRNKLGDPEQQHNVKWARKLGISDKMESRNER